ncbi:MAG: fumarylacetoacetate hydrolase family protein [Rhizobiaceae bacterium]|nr:fumarylacetoacetate hydrolase family protein [Rhizobiaceae bacterium]
MRFVRYGAPGKERPGALDNDGVIRDLSSLTSDIDGEFLASKIFAELDNNAIKNLPVVDAGERLGPPVAGVTKVIGFGVNYHSMVAERKMGTPETPILFFKAPGTLCGPTDTVVLPEGLTETVWEVEVGVVIGKTARNVNESEAMSHIAGYLTANDLTEVSFGRHKSGQWWLGKNFDTFTPIGPWLVRASEINDPYELELHLELDGKPFQRERAGGMIFKIDELVSFASRHMTLVPGDIILTGSPAGVGSNLEPKVFLQKGNVMTLGVEGLGSQRSVIA